MRNIIVALLLAALVCSCAPGAQYYAKSESDSIKKNYTDKRVQSLYEANSSLFKDIYNRYNSNNVGLYRDGIGVTTLEDYDKQQLHYLMVYVRPKDASFDMNTTKPEQRLATIIRDFVPKHIKMINPKDLDRNDIDGLAFGIYWAARDHSQCDMYGGHIEYVHIFFPKSAAQSYLNGNLSLAEAIDQSEVMASTDLRPAQSIRPVF
ncbi:MAG: hypothetical protein H6Q52_3077 [Deltaproteobacteria bacterium]|nr:hypothetical protein [Deltaproteobacteria bacterium]